MSNQPNWIFIVKKRLSWISEMLQVRGTAKKFFQESLGVNFEFRNARMILFYEFLDEDEIEIFDIMVDDLFQKNESYLEDILRKSYERCSEFEDVGNNILRTNLYDKTNNEILKIFDDFYNQSLLMIPVVYFEPNFSERIRCLLLEKLRKINREQDLDEYFLILTSTNKELTIIREQRSLIAIGAEIQQDPELTNFVIKNNSEDVLLQLPSALTAKLKQHVEDYAWINTDDMFGRPWTGLDLIVRLQHLLRKDCRQRLETALERQGERERRRIRIIEELPVEGELLRLVEIASINSHLRTHRTEVYVRTMWQASRLISELAVRIGISYKDALYFSLDELRESLISNAPLSLDELDRRRAGMAYIMIERSLETYFGEDALKLASEVGLIEETVPEITQLEGTIASMGVAQGVVKVVHDISELDKVEDGDILVASMTIPEFVPAMERAAAFVTDEGGITCHAAIVSREMGVPCIIGTEIGTKVLRDGDFVEVDANTGIIRVLNDIRA